MLDFLIIAIIRKPMMCLSFVDAGDVDEAWDSSVLTILYGTLGTLVLRSGVTFSIWKNCRVKRTAEWAARSVHGMNSVARMEDCPSGTGGDR